MNPAYLVPTPDTLPVDPLWFEVLLNVTFIVHLLLINTVLGSVFVSFFRGLAGKAESAPAAAPVAKTPTVLALAINFGVAPLLFTQVLYGQFFYPSSVVIAWYWISIIGLVMLAYYGLYLHTMRNQSLGGFRTPLLGLVLLLLLFAAFIFVNHMTLMLRPERWGAFPENPRGTLLNLMGGVEPTLFPRYLHFMTASVAVGGLFMALCWTRKKSRGAADATEADERIRSGMAWFTYATILQLLVGVWFLFTLPEGFIGHLLSGGAATLVFVLALLGAVATLITGLLKKPQAALAALVTTVTAMALLRHVVRNLYYDPFFSTTDLVVKPQYSPMLLFFVSLAAGLAVIIYMLKLAARANKEA